MLNILGKKKTKQFVEKKTKQFVEKYKNKHKAWLFAPYIRVVSTIS